jgi:hypothetical protein
MEWSDARSFAAFSSTVLSLRKDNHHRTTTSVRALQRLSDGEIWTAHGGVNPCCLFVWRGDQELRTRRLC